MDSHLFRLFCNAAEPLLLNARIEKIQEPAPEHLCMAFYGAGSKWNLYCRFGRKEPFCFISGKRVAAPLKPSAAVMRLRKYCMAKRITAVVSQVLSRKLWLMAGSAGEKTVWLCLDLANGPSLRILTYAELPEREQPEWPAPKQLAAAIAEWRSWPVLTPLLRKTLQCLDGPEQWALVADLADGAGDVFLYAGENGIIRKASAWPLPPALAVGLVEEACENPLPCLEKAGQDMVLARVCSAREKLRLASINRRGRHIRKLLDKLEQDEARLNAMIGREADARALAANLWRWKQGERAASVNVPDEKGTVRTITLPLPMLSIAGNVEKMFHDVRRGRRGLVMLKERRAALEAELAQLDAGAVPAARAGEQKNNVPQPAPISAPRGIQPFWSSDGLALLRGRNAKGNRTVLRAASGHDIWVHVENGPGAHVIIRRPHPGYAVPERTLIEAGSLAANKSWLGNAATASVMYAEARHVKPCRSGPEGKVTIDKILETRIVPVDQSIESKLAV